LRFIISTDPGNVDMSCYSCPITTAAPMEIAIHNQYLMQPKTLVCSFS
jgi:hypothetical protein